MVYPIILYSQQPLIGELQPVASTRIGRSETYFEYKLDKNFRGLVLRDQTVKDDTRRFPYQPDYIISLILHEKDPILIDVEIDEPYTTFQGNFLAIHHVGSRDGIRNQYFLSKGWDVIRLREEQIAKYPNACCKVISEHLYYRTDERVWTESFHSIEDLPNLPMCDAQASRDLFAQNHREEYIHSLKPIQHSQDAISVIADGIDFNKMINEARLFYEEEYPEKDFVGGASIKLFLTELLKYLDNFNQINLAKKEINMYIFISTYHSFNEFDISEDYLLIDGYSVNLFYIRTDKIICFEINDYVTDKIEDNLIFIGDDPAYNLLLEEWEEAGKDVIICSKHRNMNIPKNLKYMNPDMALGLSLGLKSYEV